MPARAPAADHGECEKLAGTVPPSDPAGVKWKAVVRFATAPDDPRDIASQLVTLVAWERIAIKAPDDLEIVLHLEADDAYTAARAALDRVQAATAETEFVAPELLAVNVLCLYGGIDLD